MQQETFEATGGHLGDINWSLFTGGASGFTVESTGSATCVIRKTGASTAGTYTWVLTGTDATCGTNTDDIQLTVLVTTAGAGPPLTTMEGHWTFDDGAGLIALDDSGNNNDGTLTNFPGDNSQWVTGVIGGALQFDGTNDYLNCGNDSSLNFDRTDPFSIAAWIRTTDPNGIIVAKTWGTNFDPGYEFEILNDRLQVFLIRRRNGNRFIQVEATAAGTLTDNAWHHVAMTYDGSSTAAGVTLYIDGLPVPQTTIRDNLDGSMLGIANVTVGVKGLSAMPLGGTLDDVRIYSQTLTSSDIAGLYALGVP